MAWPSEHPFVSPAQIEVDSVLTPEYLAEIGAPPPEPLPPPEPAPAPSPLKLQIGPRKGGLLQLREPKVEAPSVLAPEIPEPLKIEPVIPEDRRGIAGWSADALTQFGLGVSQALNAIPASYLAGQSFVSRSAGRPGLAGIAATIGAAGTVATPAGIYDMYRRVRGDSGAQIASDIETKARSFNDEIVRLEELGQGIGRANFPRTVGHALAGLLPYVAAGPAAPAVIAHQVFGSTYLAAKDSYQQRFPNLTEDEIEAKAFVPAITSAIGAALVWHFIPKLGRDAKGSDLLKFITEGRIGHPKDVITTLLKHMGITGAAGLVDVLQQEIVAKASYAPELTVPEVIGHALGGGLGMAALTGGLGLPRLGLSAARHLTRTPAQRAWINRIRQGIDEEARKAESEVENATTKITEQEGVPGERPGAVPREQAEAAQPPPVPAPDIADRVRGPEAGVTATPAAPPAAPPRPDARREETWRTRGEVAPFWKVLETDPSGYKILENWKEGADKKTGVVPSQRLSLPWDPAKATDVFVWERLDGTREVFSGRHTYDLWLREGKKRPLDIRLFREAEGWTREDVDLRDIIENINKNQGTQRDFGKAFRERIPNVTREQAVRENLLRTDEQKVAFDIARDGSKDVFDNWYARKIKSDVAETIVRTAPKNPAVQQIGLNVALSGEREIFILRRMQAALADAQRQGKGADQLDFFQNTINQRTWARWAAYVQSKIDELGVPIRQNRSLLEDPQQAIARGIKFDPDVAKKELAALVRLKERYENWATDEEIFKEVVEKSAPALVKSLEEADRLNNQAQAAAKAAQAEVDRLNRELKQAIAAANKLRAQTGADKKERELAYSKENQLRQARKAAIEAAKKAEENAKAFDSWRKTDPLNEPPPQLKEIGPEYRVREKTPDVKITDAADRIKQRKNWTREQPPSKDDLRDLIEAASEHAGAGGVFRDFVRRMNAELAGEPDGWDFIKGDLHEAWNRVSERGIETSQISEAEAARVVEQTQGEIFAKPEPAAPPKPSRVIKDTETAKKLAAMTEEQRAAYTHLMEAVDVFYDQNYGTGRKGSKARQKEYVGPRMWALRMAKAGYKEWTEPTGEWIDAQMQEIQKEGKQSLASLRRYNKYTRELINFVKTGGTTEQVLKRRMRGEKARAVKREDFITEEAIDRLLPVDELPKTDQFWLARAYIELLYGSGGRPEEVSGITDLAKLDFVDGVMRAVLIPKLGRIADLIMTPASAFYAQGWLQGPRQRLINQWVDAYAKKRGLTSDEIAKHKATKVLFPDPKDVTQPIEAATLRKFAQDYAKSRGVVLSDGKTPFTPQAVRGSVASHLVEGVARLGVDVVEQMIPHAGTSPTMLEQWYLTRATTPWRDTYGLNFLRTSHNIQFMQRHPGVFEHYKLPQQTTVRYKGQTFPVYLSQRRLEQMKAETPKDYYRLLETYLKGKEIGKPGEILEEGAPPEGSLPPEGRLPALRPGDRLIKIEQTDPTTGKKTIIDAVSNGKNWELGGRVVPNVGRAVEGMWSDGPLRPGERIVEPTERRFETTADLLAALDSPELDMTPEARAMLRAIVTSKMAQAMPDAVVAVTNMVRRGLAGEYLPEDDVIRLANWVKSETPVEEFLHRVFRFLSPEDKAFVAEERKARIEQELRTRDNSKEKEILELLKTRDYTTDEWLDAGYGRELYKFANDSEFFASMMERRAVSEFTKPETKGFVERVREVFKDLWQTVKRLFGMTERADDLWHSLATGTYDYDVRAAQRWGLGKPRMGSIEVPPMTAEMKEAAGFDIAARGGVETLYSEFSQKFYEARDLIERMEFDRKSYRQMMNKKEGYLWQIFRAVLDGIARSDNRYFDNPDNIPTGPLSPELGPAAAILGLPLEATLMRSEAARMKEMPADFAELADAVQREIIHERRSRQNARALLELDRLNATLAGARKLGENTEAPEYKDQFDPIKKTYEKRLDRDSRREETNEYNQTVTERGAELYDYANREVELKAKAETLKLEPIIEAFVKPKAAVEELARMMIQIGKRIPEYFGPLTPKEKEQVMLRVREIFGKFDTQFFEFKQLWEKRRVDLSKKVQELRKKLVDLAYTMNSAESMMLEKAEKSAAERGFLGTAQGQAELSYLKESIGLISTWIRQLREKYPNNTAQFVLLRLLTQPRLPRMRPKKGETLDDLRSEFKTAEKVAMDSEAELRNRTAELEKLRQEIREATDRGETPSEEKVSRERLLADEVEILPERIEYYKLAAEVMRRTTVQADALARIVNVLRNARTFEDASMIMAQYGDNLKTTEPLLRLDKIGQLIESPDLQAKKNEIRKKLEEKDTIENEALFNAYQQELIEIQNAEQWRQQEAVERLAQMQADARFQSDAAMAATKAIESDLKKMQIEMEALDNAYDMFRSVTMREVEVPPPPPPPAEAGVTPPPVYRTTRRWEPNPEYYGMIRSMANVLEMEWVPVLGNGIARTPNGTAMFFMPWKETVILADGTQKEFKHDLVTIRADESPLLFRKNFESIASYFKAAQEFVEASQEAAQAGRDLIHDVRVERGLLHMVDEMYPRLLDRTILSFLDRKKGIAAEQKILLWSFFHNHLSVLRQVAGQEARFAQGAGVEYYNEKLRVEKIGHKHKESFIRARSAAMASHIKDYGRLPSKQEYHDEIWVELNPEGRRIEGETETPSLKAGDYIPGSERRIKITPEDIALVEQNQRMYRDILDVVEHRQLGPVMRGTITEVEERGALKVYKRRAISVGEKGLPMHFGNRPGRGGELLRQLGQAYIKAKEALDKGDANQVLDSNTNLGENSQNLIVQFWNKNGGRYVRRIFGDAGRTWSSIEYGLDSIFGKRMVATMQAIFENWKRTGEIDTVRTLEDGIGQMMITYNRLFPGSPIDRVSVADYVIGLLKQYRDRQNVREPEARKTVEMVVSGGLGTVSEFTRPAAKWAAPSSWYDYGAFYDADYFLMLSRATHEPAVQYFLALKRLEVGLAKEIEYLRGGGAEPGVSHYETVNEAERVKALISKLIGQYEKSFNQNDPDAPRRAGGLLWESLKTSLLTPPPVLIRNFTFGGLMSWFLHRQLNLFSDGLGTLMNIRQVARIGATVPLHLIFSPTHPLGRKMQRYWQHPAMKRMVGNLTYGFVEKAFESHRAALDDLEVLGLAKRDPFMESVQAIWKRTMEFEKKWESEQAHRSKISYGVTLAWRSGKNVLRTLTQFYRLIGTEYMDLMINSVAVGYYGTIDRGLRDAALRHYRRIRAMPGGDKLEYDPTNPIFDVWADDLSMRKTKAGRQQNLADWQDFLTGTDIDLSRTFWRYGKEYERKQNLAKKERAEIKQRQEAGLDVSEDLENLKYILEEPDIFNPVEVAGLKTAILRDMNAADAFNRPTAMTNSKLFNMLATFQGWSARFFVDFMRQFARSRANSATWNIMRMVPLMLGYAVSAAVLSQVGLFLVDQYRRHFQGQSKRMVTAFDKEFWQTWSTAKDSLHVGILATMPIYGDIVLYVKNSIANNRGYEPTGRILAFGVANSLLNTVRGMWNLRHDPSNVVNPLRDFVLQFAAYGKEISNLAGTQAHSSMRQRAAESILRVRVQSLGLGGDTEPSAVVRRGPVYSATSGMREDFYTAMVRRDEEKLANTYQRLVAYYADKGAENPVQNAVRDLRYMNPIVRAFGNRKPTADEYRKVYEGLAEDQKQDVDTAIANWNWAANRLNVTFNPISTGRAEPGSAAISIAPGAGGSALPAATRGGGGPQIQPARISYRGAPRGLSIASLRPGGRFGGRPSFRRARIRVGRIRSLRPRRLRLRAPRRRRLRYRAPRSSIA